eukprot:10110654-Heterocapsa_arctica.AAC.1
MGCEASPRSPRCGRAAFSDTGCRPGGGARPRVPALSPDMLGTTYLADFRECLGILSQALL